MREMRRQDRKLGPEEISEILENGEYGVLATVTDDGKPYSIPISYAFDGEDNVIYMHCSADGGQKIDNLRIHPEVCLTVVGSTELMPEKFATRYWSVNVFGTVTIIEDGSEKQKGIETILRRYSPEYVEKGLKYIEGAIQKIYILRLEIRASTGKARKK